MTTSDDRARARLASRLAAVVTSAVLLASVVHGVAAADVGGGAPAVKRTLGGPGHAEMYPSGMEIAPDGTIVVADTGNNRIHKYAADGSRLWSVGGFGTTVGKFNNPRDIGIDANGNIYVADTANNRIVKLGPGGAWATFWRGPAVDKTGTPMGVSVTGTKVYVADAGKKRVRVWNLALDTQLASFGQSGECTFSAIRDVDAAPNGDVYVANYTQNNVLRMGASGDCISRWGTKGTGDGQFKNPYGVRVAFDPVRNASAVYVADSNNSRIQVFTLGGAFLAKMGTFGDHTQEGTFGALRRVAVASDGDVWGADLWAYRLVRFNRTSTGYSYAQTIPDPVVAPPLTNSAVFNEVRTVAFGPDGVVNVVDTVNQRIVRMTKQGVVLGACGERGWSPGAFNWPRGVAVDDQSGNLWVADTKQSRLQVIKPDCSSVAIVGKQGTALDRFNWPHAVAIRQADRLAFVADTKNHRIVVYDAATRTPVAAFGSQGAGFGQFTQPRGIAVNPSNGQILVADTLNHRIVVLSATAGGALSWVRTYTGFKRPEGVAADAAGNVYVADSNSNRVVILHANGDVHGTITGFAHPDAVAVDAAAGELYVSDTFNDRVRVYGTI